MQFVEERTVKNLDLVCERVENVNRMWWMCDQNVNTIGHMLFNRFYKGKIQNPSVGVYACDMRIQLAHYSMNFLFFIFWVTASSADPIVKTALARPFQFHPQHFAPRPTHKYSIPFSLSYLFPTKLRLSQFRRVFLMTIFNLILLQDRSTFQWVKCHNSNSNSNSSRELFPYSPLFRLE